MRIVAWDADRALSDAARAPKFVSSVQLQQPDLVFCANAFEDMDSSPVYGVRDEFSDAGYDSLAVQNAGYPGCMVAVRRQLSRGLFHNMDDTSQSIWARVIAPGLEDEVAVVAQALGAVPEKDVSPADALFKLFKSRGIAQSSGMVTKPVLVLLQTDPGESGPRKPKDPLQGARAILEYMDIFGLRDVDKVAHRSATTPYKNPQVRANHILASGIFRAKVTTKPLFGIDQHRFVDKKPLSGNRAVIADLQVRRKYLTKK